MKELVCKIIKKVLMDPTNETVSFVTDSGDFCYQTHGGCCSETWINHISGLECLINNVVTKFDKIEMPELNRGDIGFSGRQDVDSVYSYKLFTKDGVCEIEMRNASNGYYGGWLQKCVGEIRQCDGLREVTENF